MMILDGGPDLLAIDPRPREQNASTAMQKGSPNLQRRCVERKRRQLQRCLRWPEMRILLRKHQANDSAVWYFDTFRLSCRSRRVDDVSRLIWTDFDFQRLVRIALRFIRAHDLLTRRHTINHVRR